MTWFVLMTEIIVIPSELCRCLSLQSSRLLTIENATIVIEDGVVTEMYRY